MFKKYFYFICHFVFIFCLSCAGTTDSQSPASPVGHIHPTRGIGSSAETENIATSPGADLNVNIMQQTRDEKYGSGAMAESMGMPPGAGPDLGRMQEMRSRMFGGGFAAETIKNLPARSDSSAPKPTAEDASGNLIQRGKELFKAEEYQLAAVKFEAFLKDHEFDDLTPEALYYLGESYYKQEKYAEAIKAYKKIAQFFKRYPLAPNAVYKMAKCYEKLGQSQKAQGTLKQLKVNYPQFDPAAVEKD